MEGAAMSVAVILALRALQNNICACCARIPYGTGGFSPRQKVVSLDRLRKAGVDLTTPDAIEAQASAHRPLYDEPLSCPSCCASSGGSGGGTVSQEPPSIADVRACVG